MSGTTASRGQLAWHCRRGMKELDLLLLAYLQGRWASAATDEKAAFACFLELPDPVIASYLLGGEEPPAGMLGLVATLRGAAEKPA
ncbi:MAG: succinate dehydrogenase assembly factor 2 [Pseudomonadota bacterium]